MTERFGGFFYQRKHQRGSLMEQYKGEAYKESIQTTCLQAQYH